MLSKWFIYKAREHHCMPQRMGVPNLVNCVTIGQVATHMWSDASPLLLSKVRASHAANWASCSTHNLTAARLWCCADSRGRTRALFTASAGNTQSPVHVPASLGLSNIVSLTYSDSSDVVRGNTGYALKNRLVVHLQSCILLPRPMLAALQQILMYAAPAFTFVPKHYCNAGPFSALVCLCRASKPFFPL